MNSLKDLRLLTFVLVFQAEGAAVTFLCPFSPLSLSTQTQERWLCSREGASAQSARACPPPSSGLSSGLCSLQPRAVPSWGCVWGWCSVATDGCSSPWIGIFKSIYVWSLHTLKRQVSPSDWMLVNTHILPAFFCFNEWLSGFLWG